MERREVNAMTFDSVYNASIPGCPTCRVGKPFVGCGGAVVLLEETACVRHGGNVNKGEAQFTPIFFF